MQRITKKFMVAILMGVLLCVNCIYVFASSSASVALQYGDRSAETSKIGTSKNAVAEGLSSTQSECNIQYDIWAAWAGWPYTREQSHALGPGGYGKWPETQSRSSYYFLRMSLLGSSNAVDLGKIYLQ